MVLQYLKEAGLTGSFNKLMDETGITMNTVDNVESLVADITTGRWGSVELPSSAGAGRTWLAQKSCGGEGRARDFSPGPGGVTTIDCIDLPGVGGQ